jgi:hypothetical protein
MKNIIFIIVIIFVSCGPSAEEIARRAELDREVQALNKQVLHGSFIINPAELNSGEYIVEIIDSCEYVTGWSGGYHGGPLGMHKGNCRFCQARLDAKLDTMLARFYRQLKHK